MRGKILEITVCVLMSLVLLAYALPSPAGEGHKGRECIVDLGLLRQVGIATILTTKDALSPLLCIDVGGPGDGIPGNHQ